MVIKLASLILSLTLSIAAQTFCVLFTNGAGEYLVGTYSDLEAVGVGGCSLASHYRLTADLDASASLTENLDSGFVSIGDSVHPFTGAFHGAGHTITHLNTNRPDSAYVGMFGMVGASGVVDSLGILLSSVKGCAYVGSLAGYNSGTINASYSTGTARVVTSTNVGLAIQTFYSGGLVGYNAGTISASNSGDSTTASTQTISGYNSQGTYVNRAPVAYIGSLVGFNMTGAQISASNASGVVSLTSTSSAALAYGGGLAGGNSGTILQSFATGNVASNNGSSVRVGGLVGMFSPWEQSPHVTPQAMILYSKGRTRLQEV